MPRTPSSPAGKPRAGKYKPKAKGHAYGNCSQKRALIKQRVHLLEVALKQSSDTQLELVERQIELERIVEFLNENYEMRVNTPIKFKPVEAKRTHVLNEDGDLVEENPD